MGFGCNLTGRQDLSVPIDDMGDVHHFGFGGKGLGVLLHEIGIVFTGQVEVDPDQFDLVAQFPLFPGIDHIGIILFGQHHFISLLKRQSKDHGFQSFG